MTVVLLTRPAGQNERMADLLRLQGARVLDLPLLEILPIAGDRTTMLDLDQYDHIIFISSNAATLGLRALSDLWPQWPVALRWYAVGRTTAAAMEEWDLTVQVPRQEDSAGLLALPSLVDIADQRVLIVRGQGGREVLAEALRARGAGVDYLEVYARKPVTLDDEAKKTLSPFNAVIALLYSGETTAALAANFEGSLSRFHVVVPSNRVAELAVALGFETVRSAGGADEAAMMGAARELLAAAGGED